MFYLVTGAYTHILLQFPIAHLDPGVRLPQLQHFRFKICGSCCVLSQKLRIDTVHAMFNIFVYHRVVTSKRVYMRLPCQSMPLTGPRCTIFSWTDKSSRQVWRTASSKEVLNLLMGELHPIDDFVMGCNMYRFAQLYCIYVNFQHIMQENV